MERKLPSYPLFVFDPYFSFHSNGDLLNNSDVTFWNSKPHKMYGFLKIDGKNHLFLGNGDFPKLIQKSIEISTFKTKYSFEGEDFKFNVEFVSPLPLDDLELLSMPICYMNYEFISENEHEIEVCLCLGEDWLYNSKPYENCVKVDDFYRNGYILTSFRLKRQLYLAQADDEVMADCGSFFLSGESVGRRYIRKDKDVEDSPRSIYIYAKNSAKKGFIGIGRDSVLDILYFNEGCNGYWYKDGKTIFDAFDRLYKEHDSIENELNVFDLKLKEQASKISKDYEQILLASYSQAVSAHKLVTTSDGELLFISKECGSNGCAATVDITYPTSPILLLFNPSLLKASLKPIFDFAKCPIWKYDFAPHDVGTYPNLTGQTYGLIEVDPKEPEQKKSSLENWGRFFTYPELEDVYLFEKQMPVEESSNMIILSYAYATYAKDAEFIKEHIDVLSTWAKYLLEHGYLPENQLCTDDFAGHLDKNVNLSIKAAVALRCFAEISKELNDVDSYELYKKEANRFVEHIESLLNDNNYLPLTFEKGDTRYSLKYNLAFDKLFSFNLFHEDTYTKECEEYKKHFERFGIPLDPRHDYTKADWLMWIATFADKELQNGIFSSMTDYLENSVSRDPFPDWYSSIDGRNQMFRNRSVVGGNFFPLLFAVKKINK